ncbi:MAG: catalase HPII, partial [Chitinophagaceae bacterium]
HGVGADAENSQEPIKKESSIKKSKPLSMVENPTVTNTIATRQIAFLCADGVNENSVNNMKKALETAGAKVHIIAPHLGTIKTEGGTDLAVDQTYLMAASVLFDGTFVPDGKDNKKLAEMQEVQEFINDSFKHCKYIAAEKRAKVVLEQTNAKPNIDEGVLTDDKDLTGAFIKKLGTHRFWKREKPV